MTARELLDAYATGQRSFIGAYLSDADLSGADLSDADLRNATLRSADLRNAYLSGVDIENATLPNFQIVPDAGAFKMWRKMYVKGVDGGRLEVVGEFDVPADAFRTSSLVGRKCRVSHATCVAIYDANGTAYASARGTYNRDMWYAVGETAYADDWNDDIRVECTHGIHGFITMREAWEYA